MEFIPNQEETKLLSKIINVYNGEYTLIRLTPTMLEKSIIDAGQDFRSLLSDNDILDYYSIIPGEDKLFPDSVFITSEVIPVKLACYRPRTKKGDPRFWIYGLKKIIRNDEMLYITTFNGQVTIIPLVEHYFDIDTISKHLKNNDTSHLDECLALIRSFANQDILSVSPTKLNPKDVGDTLERELNINPNVSKLADYKGLIELKAKRHGVRTKDTLFSMVPNWIESNIQSSSEMIFKYGYPSNKYEDYNDLYVTVSNKRNNQGLYLEVDYDKQVVIQYHESATGDVTSTCIWNFSELKSRLFSKHPETLWLIAKSIQKDNSFYFRYESIEHTCSPIFSSFLLLISQGIITYDWRGRVRKDGTGYKDKGHCFRIKPSHRNLLFGTTEQIEL